MAFFPLQQRKMVGSYVHHEHSVNLSCKRDRNRSGERSLAGLQGPAAFAKPQKGQSLSRLLYYSNETLSRQGCWGGRKPPQHVSVLVRRGCAAPHQNGDVGRTKPHRASRPTGCLVGVLPERLQSDRLTRR